MDAFKVLMFLCVTSFCDCRDVSSNVGIYGGHQITIEQAPFMAQVTICPSTDIFGCFVCGGSIIHERFVLSAAHCCRYSNIQITVGSTKIKMYNPNKDQVYEAESYSIHPNFSVANFDACLIKVSRSIELRETVSIIQLADSTLELTGDTMLNVTGWGRTKRGRTNHLMQVSVPFVDQAQCREDYLDDSIHGNITSDMICAGGKGKSTCFGDSGGPVTKGSVQVGVISFVHDKGCAWAPGVNTKVSSILEWIQSTIDQNFV